MNNHESTDDRIRHESALLHAHGETRKAIATLITRINETNGHCNPKIWLCVLDLYQIEQQEAAYEKLAVFFSNRFHYSPPAWRPPQAKTTKTSGQWRNALIVEGKASEIHPDKIKDFLRASKEAKSSRLDLSRMRLSSQREQARKETSILLTIMNEIKRLKCPTMLMGDAELMAFLNECVAQDRLSFERNMLHVDYTDPNDTLSPFWLLLMEIYQWRGMQDEFDSLAMEFTEMFHWCPVGYNDMWAVAKVPSNDTNDTPPLSSTLNGHMVLPAVVLDGQALCTFAQQQWDQHLPAEFSFEQTARLSADAAQELTHLVEAQSHPDGIDVHDTVLHDVSEIVFSLLETTGLHSLATIHHRYEKLRHLLEV